MSVETVAMICAGLGVLVSVIFLFLMSRGVCSLTELKTSWAGHLAREARRSRPTRRLRVQIPGPRWSPEIRQVASTVDRGSS